MPDRPRLVSSCALFALAFSAALLAGCGSGSGRVARTGIVFVHPNGDRVRINTNSAAEPVHHVVLVPPAHTDPGTPSATEQRALPASLESAPAPRPLRVLVPLAAGDAIGQAIFAARCSELARAAREQRSMYAGVLAAE